MPCPFPPVSLLLPLSLHQQGLRNQKELELVSRLCLSGLETVIKLVSQGTRELYARFDGCGVPAGLIHTSERSRRAAARSAAEEEAQTLARHWRNIQRSLQGASSLWPGPRKGTEDLHWKLDKHEDPSRRWPFPQTR